ncbi:hypothetical protein GCM10009119_37940 [Algoriphagus jejuensis]|uniref:CinA C-terminal domain-containing protein n=2 Tax=Algoriphagus jejuensis TaxID=419934 RepID=A0ABP3YJV0_9BACT
MLSAAPEAGLFFKGGLTTYSCGAKNRLLNIPEQQCKLVSGVSPDIAGMMAENVRKVYDSEIGMGITGFAALVPELGIVTKYAFASVVLNDRVQHRFNFMSTKATQAEVQIDFAAQLVLACADCLHDARIEIR